MNWEEIVGQKKVIETLKDAIDKERVGHAQLFIGEEGFAFYHWLWLMLKKFSKEKMNMLLLK